jgi:hypothetical protein
MMTSCGQNDVAMADNKSYNKTLSTSIKENNTNNDPSLLNESNRSNFIKRHKEKAKKISQDILGGAKIFALKKGYEFNNKYYWAVIVKKESLKLYVFDSDLSFSNVNHELVKKTTNLKEYIIRKN